METVGLIGLGNMGGPVAGHIQRAGFPMVVYDLRVAGVEPGRSGRYISTHPEVEGKNEFNAAFGALIERQVVMKFRRFAVFVITTLTPALIVQSVPAASDQLEEVLREQTKARQEEKIKAVKQQEQLETLKRDQQSSQAQQQLDQIKRQKDEALADTQKPQATQTQQQLDQLRNDQQLQRLQSDQQINRIQRETDPVRQQQQLNDLQRQQQIRSLQDQIQRNQTQQDLDRLRQQPSSR